MLCEKCKKNEATFFYRENVNGQKKNYNLCADCAREYEEEGKIPAQNTNPFEGFEQLFMNPFKSMDKFFSGLFGEKGTVQSALGSGKSSKTCSCGMTFRDFMDDGMAGCPSCYETFESELEPTVKRIHGRTVHEGRTPARFREKLDLRKKIENLEKERDEAVRKENYERAAELRDQLNDLRKSAGGEA